MELAAGASSTRLPSTLVDIVDDFNAMAPNERVQLLLEPVRECQSPISLTVEVGGSGEQEPVALFFSAPPEAPPPRGLAGILAECLDGLTARDILAVPDDAACLSLTGSPGRRRG